MKVVRLKITSEGRVCFGLVDMKRYLRRSDVKS